MYSDLHRASHVGSDAPRERLAVVARRIQDLRPATLRSFR